MLDWLRINGGRTQRRLPRQPDAMDNDWRVGDCAECIVTFVGNWAHMSNGESTIGPKPKDIDLVIGVYVADGQQWLQFARFKGKGVYPAGWFRKLRKASASFTKRLRQPLRAPKREKELTDA